LPADVGWISTVGPIGVTPADIRVALAITADRRGAPPARPLCAQSLRLGVMLDDPGCPLGSDVGVVLSDTVDRIAAAGVEVIEGWPPGIDGSATMPSFGFALQRFMAAAGPTSQWSATDADIERHLQAVEPGTGGPGQARRRRLPRGGGRCPPSCRSRPAVERVVRHDRGRQRRRDLITAH
jgi:hypothetical protein